MKKSNEYKVSELKEYLIIDGNWNKPEWEKAETCKLDYCMGEALEFTPTVEFKMMYDSLNVFIIFKVTDKYVRCVTSETNGPVYEDTCVEFFFAPDENAPLKYFNLETNCGGTALMFYNLIPRKDYKIVNPDDIGKIEIAHSMPKIVDPEITEPVTWTVEYRIPYDLLKKYAIVSQPHPGVIWKGNFYKIGDKTSNPHYLTWSLIDQKEPDFHLPTFFGTLVFQ